METPIFDFIQHYNENSIIRLHMPGHKGVPFLGCESMDLTEVFGADSLYEAEGIIAQSEANATALFGSYRTLYGTEGSSQCIRAMLYLALLHRQAGSKPVVVAARNVHKAFVYAAALLDFQVVWLYPDGKNHSICGCPITPEHLEQTLTSLDSPPAAVYLTSPDYLGGTSDLHVFAEICHRHHTFLAVDNAHGAYLHFLPHSAHPMDAGADICCDSAHKTLPVLTGGAYLHIRTPMLAQDAKAAMALFGSTSPSYLTLASLDLCNRYLADCYPLRLKDTIHHLSKVKQLLQQQGWEIMPSDPLKLTILAPAGITGLTLASVLREAGMECEYADPNALVLMITPEIPPDALNQLPQILGINRNPCRPPSLHAPVGKQVCSIRESFFSPHEIISANDSAGRICGAPTVGCPPAIPIVVSGEEITPESLSLFAHYGIKTVDVLK